MIGLPLRQPRADLRRDLALLADGRPPFLSVYLDISAGAPRDTALDRLRSGLESTTSAAGAPGLDALGPHRARIESALLDHHEDDALFVAILNADGSLLTTTYPDPPRHDVFEVAGIPRLGPLLVADQSLTHHVVAVVQGCDLALMTVPRHGEPTHTTYAGDDPLGIAPIVQHACRSSSTRLLVLCAPSDELTDLEQQVRSGLDIEVSLATIATDGLDDRSLATEIVVRTADHAATKTVELLRLWRFQHAHGEAVDGLHPTCAAIAGGRAALVLVHDDERDERTAWIGPEATSISPDDGTAQPAAGTDRSHGRLSDAVIRAALAAGCGVHLVPNVEHTLRDGLGAVLADRATPEGLAELLER